MNIEVGNVIHGLKIIAHCGGGAYGDVYYCEDISGKRLALKVINKKRLGGVWKRELQGVINYRRITEGAPNLLRILHVAEDDETFYYTMEAADSASTGDYLPDTLAQRLQSGPLPSEQLYPVIRGIFEGIKTIHEAGFAHRDIKPDNILFVDGVPKLGDIGLLSSLSSTLTTLAGTLEFLPPEVRAADSPKSSDRASRQRNDLYAFGKVIYCAATGLEPGMFPTVPTREKLSPELKLFLNLAFKLCAKTPERRISDDETLARELERIEKNRWELGKFVLPCSEESVKKFPQMPVAINEHIRNIFKWFCIPAVTIILFLSGVICYRVLHRHYPELLKKPPVRQTTGTGSIPDSRPAEPVVPPPPRKMTEQVKEETPAANVSGPVESKTRPSAVKPKTEPAPGPVAEDAKSGEKDAKSTVVTAETTKAETEISSTELLRWMLRNLGYREIAQERIAELKETEDLRKAGKYDVSDDPSRALEEKLWKNAAYLYKRNHSSFPYYLRRIEQIRETRKAFESAAAAEGNDPTKTVVPELAFHIGWLKYRELRNSKRFGKIITDHEAEIAAERERRKSGAAVPEPGSDAILEKKLWENLNKIQSDEQILYILEHIEYVRKNRGTHPAEPEAPAGNDVKKFVYEELKFQMHIPKNWIIATNTGRDIADAPDAGFSPEQLNDTQKKFCERMRYISRFSGGAAIVFCDDDREWRDMISVEKSLISGGALSSQDVKLSPTEVRTSFAGRCCVIDTDDKSSQRDPLIAFLDLQTALYYIDDGNTCILFVLRTKKATFQKRRQELEAALRTMKFHL